MAAIGALIAVAHAGVVARGDALQAPLFGRPGEHRSKFHLPVAAGAGKGRHAFAIALHQEINNLLLEMLPKIHHVVGHAQLLTDPGGIHQPFRAAGALATHQPQGEALHLPTGFHQQGCGE